MSLIPPKPEDRALLGFAAAVGGLATVAAQIEDSALRTVCVLMGIVFIFGLAWKATPPANPPK